MEPHVLECRSDDHPSTGALPATSRFDLRRVYTALVLAPLVYLVIRYLPPIALIGLVLAVGTIALYEFYGLFFQDRTNRLLVGIGLSALTYLLASYHWGGPDLTVLFVATAAALTLPLFTGKHQMLESSVTIFGVSYIGIALSFLILIRSFPQGEYLLLFILLITWIADTGAYYVGKLFGRHPIAPLVSPKKTVEGLLGGLAFAIITVYVARGWVPYYDLSVMACVLLGSMLTIAGLVGDLVESAIKRNAGVKDSSRLLPGHGGMLDRIDSLLFTAPTFYYYIRISGIPNGGL